MEPCFQTGTPETATCLRLPHSLAPGETGSVARAGFGLDFGIALFLLDAAVDFLAVNRDVAGCLDTETHLVALHTQHRNGDFVADGQGLTDAPG